MSRITRTWLAITLWLGAACTQGIPRSESGSGRSAGGEPRQVAAIDRDLLDACPNLPLRVSLCQLFAELVDLRHLSERPHAEFTSHMVSSFDRASSTAAPGDEAWLANHDFALLTPGEPLTLLDTDGPGVLTRIWSANPSGTLRIYLDRAREPAVEADMRDLLRGAFAPVGPGFGFEAAHGSNLYLPVPYQSHCRVTLTSAAHKLFYQVSYRSYRADVRVEPFSLAALRANDGMPSRVRERLSRASPALAATRAFTLTRDAPTYTLAADSGGSQLRELRARVRQPTAAALRSTMLQIWVDDEETVRAPFGDFFGSGQGLQDVTSLPLQVVAAEGSFVSRWPMPFHSRLRVALTQTDAHAEPLIADFELAHEAHAFAPDQLLFHAQWSAPDWQSSEPSHEYTLRALSGDGYYVGTLLNVINSDAAWWGEGDEHIWVDDDVFPSFFGTGTEDYFGYGWCSNQTFSLPYIGQTRADPHANFGRISLYRFHVFDPIRFASKLRFDLEVNHWGNTPSPIEYDSIAYFYARPGATSSPAPSALESYRIPELDLAPPDDVRAGDYRCGGD